MALDNPSTVGGVPGGYHSGGGGGGFSSQANADRAAGMDSGDSTAIRQEEAEEAAMERQKVANQAEADNLFQQLTDMYRSQTNPEYVKKLNETIARFGGSGSPSVDAPGKATGAEVASNFYNALQQAAANRPLSPDTLTASEKAALPEDVPAGAEVASVPARDPTPLVFHGTTAPDTYRHELEEYTPRQPTQEKKVAKAVPGKPKPAEQVAKAPPPTNPTYDLVDRGIAFNLDNMPSGQLLDWTPDPARLKDFKEFQRIRAAEEKVALQGSRELLDIEKRFPDKTPKEYDEAAPGRRHIEEIYLQEGLEKDLGKRYANLPPGRAYEGARRNQEVLGILKNLVDPIGEEPWEETLMANLIPGISTARELKGSVNQLDEWFGPWLDENLGRATDEESEANRALYEARGDNDGNIRAIQNFLSNPTYAGIPEIDSISALSALQNAVGGLQGVVDERGFTGQGYAQAGRQELSDIFDAFQPGQDFDSLLNELIGQTAGSTALFNKDIELRGQGTEAVGTAFPGDSTYFDPKAFNAVANNILEGRFASATEQISNAEARGNLSSLGASRGVESLSGQRAGAETRLGEIGSGLRGGQDKEVGAIGERALTGATGFKLGDELFDVTPFETERDTLIAEREGSLGEDFRSQLGGEQLFDTGLALRTAGQGQTTAGGNLLNIFADRELGALPSARRRGLGSAGTGAF